MHKNGTDNLALRLRRLMLQHGNLSEADLARATSLPQPTIHRLISGDTLDPRISTLQIIAQYFEVTLDYLLAKEPLLPLSELELLKQQGTHLLPIIEWEDVLSFLKNKSRTLEKYSVHGHWTSTELSLSEKAFVLLSRTSMEPRFPRGTLIFIEPTTQASDGDLVLIHYSHNEQVALRHIMIDGNQKMLHSLISSTTEPFEEGHQIIGIVVQTKYTYYPSQKIAQIAQTD